MKLLQIPCPSHNHFYSFQKNYNHNFNSYHFLHFIIVLYCNPNIHPSTLCLTLLRKILTIFFISFKIFHFCICVICVYMFKCMWVHIMYKCMYSLFTEEGYVSCILRFGSSGCHLAPVSMFWALEFLASHYAHPTFM